LFICLFVCLFVVSSITQKLLNRFSKKIGGNVAYEPRKKDSILVENRILILIQEFFKRNFSIEVLAVLKVLRLDTALIRITHAS